MSTSPPLLTDIAFAAGKDVHDLVSVFLVGSRAWGTETAASDWDYFVVVKGETQQAPLEMTDDGRINLTIFSLESWRRWLGKEHNLQAIACLYLPSSNVLLNNHDWSKEFALDRKQLRFAALRKASSSFNRARIYWLGMKDKFNPLPTKRIQLTKEDEETIETSTKEEAVLRPKKMIVHGLRTVLFALQLFETGHISDLKCAVPLWKELLLESDDAEWQYYANKYEAMWKELANRFPDDCPPLSNPELMAIPETLHRLHYLVNLPTFQRTYQQGIERELFTLLRAERTSLTSEFANISTEPTTPMAELIERYFPTFGALKEQYAEVSRRFDAMAQLLQVDYDNLTKVVQEKMKRNGTKAGQECAALAKPYQHYTLLFGLFKSPGSSAQQYLLTCPWTHFDIMEHYWRQNPSPAVFPAPQTEAP